MKKFSYYREDDESLITIPSFFDNEKITFALDTGATHSVIDLTRLLLAGYEMKDAVATISLESAKGEVQGYIFKIHSLNALGIQYQEVEVCAYDFLANNILTEIDGVLGLDFFRNEKLCIDFEKSEITIR